MLILHAKRRFATGLQWSVHDTLVLARRQARETPRASVVRSSIRDEHNGEERIVLGVYLSPLRAETFCAALAVGLVLPDAVVCQSLEDGRVWLCVISNGLPFPEQDRILGADEAASALQGVRTYAPVLVGDQPGATRALNEVLSVFLAQVAARQWSRRQLKAIRLQAQSPGLRRIARYGAMLLLPLLGFFAWQSWQKFQALQRGQALSLAKLAESRAETAKAAALRQQSLDAFHQRVVQERHELAALPALTGALWRHWNRVRRSLPLSAGGYVPASLRCDAKTCIAVWSSRSAWTRIADKRLIPGWVPDTDPALLAQAAYPVSAIAPSRAPAAKWDSAAALRFQLAAAMQFLAPAMQLDAGQAVVLPAPPDLGLEAQTLGAKGKLRLLFQGPAALVQADDAMAVLVNWPVQIDSVNWTSLAGPQLSVEVQGSYVFVP